MQLNSIKNQRQQFCLVWARKHRRTLPVTNNNSSSSQLSTFFSVHCWLDSLTKYWFFFLLRPTIGDKMSWDTSPYMDFLMFSWLQKGKRELFVPHPLPQCCATVRATFRKQETSQRWMEGTGEGCGFLCSLKLPYLSLNNFVASLSESQKWPHILRKINSTMSLCRDVKPPVAFYLLCLTLSCLLENN